MRKRRRLNSHWQRILGRNYGGKPIGPRSVIVVRDDHPGPYGRLLGQTLRVGYYSKQDGLNVIWIVYPNAEYGETTDHTHLRRYFRVVSDSGEIDYYGDNKPILLPLL